MIVYTYMVMDIYHRGHRAQLRNARAVAGENGLVVLGILTDAAVMERKPCPTLTFDERYEIASDLELVDLVACQATYSPLPNVEALRPDVLMESSSHTKEDIANARALLARWGGSVIVTPYYEGVSSTEIKQRVIGEESR